MGSGTTETHTHSALSYTEAMNERDLPEFLFAAGGRYTTLQVEIRDWVNTDLRRQAHIQELRRNPYVDEKTVQAASSAPTVADRRTPAEVIGFFCMERPAKWRNEELRSGESSARVSIVCGAKWWNQDPFFGVRSNLDPDPYPYVGPPQLPWYVHWLNLSNAPEIYTLDVVGQTIHAGRHAVKLRATPRKVDPEVIPWEVAGLWPGADEIKILVDIERGLLLNAAGYLSGRLFEELSVRSIAFDQPLPQGIFSIPPEVPSMLDVP